MQDLAFEYSSKPTFQTLADIKDKKVTIMGLGLNGGGEASTRFFLKHGAYVTITDMKSAEQLAQTISSLENDPTLDHPRIRYVLGKHEIEDFATADVVIKNPGVKYCTNQYLKAAKAIETDLSIFLHFTKAPIIAVTGSKGKSSTVSAIYYGLQKAGFNAFLGGNITISPLTFLEKTDETTPVVLELSSWQLSDLRGRKLLKPKIALITKIVPDHQNWYGNMESYVADKKLIYADQNENDFSIFTADDEWGQMFASESKAQIFRYSSKSIPQKGVFLDSAGKGYIKLSQTDKAECVLDEISIPGNHMKENLLNAALVMHLMGVENEKAKQILQTFPGVPHRLEFCHEWQNANGIKIKFYNDSAATVPEASVAALQAFEKPVFLCGGTDKELNFTLLAKNAHLAKKLFLLSGTGSDKLIPLLNENKTEFCGPYQSLVSALEEIKRYLETLGDTDVLSGMPRTPGSDAIGQNAAGSATNKNAKTCEVVFSPGATSFGMFANEFDRGNQFKKAVKEIFC